MGDEKDEAPPPDPDVVTVKVGKPDNLWAEIEILAEDVADPKKMVANVEEKLREVIELPEVTVDNYTERKIGDLHWDELTFDQEVNGKYWEALIVALHHIRQDFIKQQRKVEHLAWYLAVKENSDKRNPKYYV